MATASVNGIELYYELHGSGGAVTVIPGLGGDTRMFSSIVTALAERHQVLVFDPRGSGRSEKPDVPYTAEEMADDTAGLLDAVGMQAPTVIGYSMGVASPSAWPWVTQTGSEVCSSPPHQHGRRRPVP